jgi:calcineurin-like phosphoesterase family protein
MNSVLLNNWNGQVGENDKIFFVGDISFGHGHRPANYWVKGLHGRIVFINGNHGEYEKGLESVRWENNGVQFYLVHNPADVPPGWNGWVIHGHKHNNDVANYPFFDRKTKRFNVSVELTDYKPVEIGDLRKLMNSEIDRLERWDSQTKSEFK